MVLHGDIEIVIVPFESLKISIISRIYVWKVE